MKKWLYLVLCLMFLLACKNSVYNEINVYLNGERLEFDVSPMIVENHVMMQVCVVFEALGADVFWIPDYQRFVANIGDAPWGGGFQFVMSINEPQVNVNFPVDSTIILLDIPPMVVDGLMLVPLQAISKSLRVSREWCEELQALDVDIDWCEEYPMLGTNIEWMAETQTVLMSLD